MKKPTSGNAESASSSLRRRAEDKVQADEAKATGTLSPEAARQALHELRVHQIELEMQNDELRRTQAELEASRARYFDLYDLAPVGYFSLSEEGLILEANLAASGLVGVARSALVRHPLSRLILPEDQDIYYRHRRQLVKTGAPQVCEIRMLRTAAAPFWVRMEATVVPDADGASLYRAVVSDITERKQIDDAHVFLLQRAHQHSGERFLDALARYLAESLGMDYVCIDRLLGDALTAQTVAIYNDGKFEDNVEYALKDTPCGDVVGKTICCFPEKVRHLFPRDAVLQTMMAESYAGTTLWSFDGQPIGLIALIGRKRLANPRLVESVLKLVAVRAAGELERRQAEEALRRTAEELTRSNQDLEQFASVASHDLKEPLRMVTAFMGLLKERYQDRRLDAKAGEYIAFASDAAGRMQGLIDDLLQYARVGQGAVTEPTDVSAVVDRALQNLGASIVESGARVTCDSLPTVRANAMELTQLFQNLIGNAIKFRRPGVPPEIHLGATKKGSGVSVQVTGGPVQDSHRETSGPDTRHPTPDTVSWLFSVRDNGIGIDPQYSDRVFAIFQRLHAREEYSGSGIGLAICKKIVERYGGRIWVESEAGKGAVFCFTLPA